MPLDAAASEGAAGNRRPGLCRSTPPGPCRSTPPQAVPFDAAPGRAARTRRPGEREVAFHGVVKVTELARRRIRVARADELPESVVGVMADVQDRLFLVEDLEDTVWLQLVPFT